MPATAPCPLPIPDEPPDWLRVAFHASPIFQARAERWHQPYGRTLQQLADELIGLPPGLRHLLRCEIDGWPIEPALWPRVKPRPGRRVMFWLAPGGGGDGKSVGMIVGAIALIAISIYAPYVGGAAAAAMGLTTTTATGATVLTTGGALVAAGISAGITIGAAIAINMLFKPSLPKERMSGGEAASQGYFLTSAKNAVKPGERIMRVYGRHKVVPAFAAKPYSISRGNLNDLYLLYDFGYGPLELADHALDGNPITLYPSVELQIHPSYKAGDPLAFYAGTVSQDAYDVELKGGGASFTTRAGAEGDRLLVDFLFPTGLFIIRSKDGDYRNRTVQLELLVRGVDPVTQAVSAWTSAVVLPMNITPAYGTANAGFIEVTRQSPDRFVLSVEINLGRKGLWDIQVRKVSVDGESEKNQFDQVRFAALTVFDPAPPIRPKKPHTIVEMRVRASQELQNQLGQYSAIATSLLNHPTAGGTEILAPSRSPALIYLDVLRGTASKKPLTMDRIDLDAIGRWAQFCTRPDAVHGEEMCLCDCIIDYQTTTWEILKAIAGTGRATPTMREGKVSVAWDDPDLTPVQMFTIRNSAGFQAKRVAIDLPDKMVMRHVQESAGWVYASTPVYNDGYNEDGSGGLTLAERIEEVELFGILRTTQAYRDGRYLLAQGKLRPETYTITVDAENLRCTRGDLVLIAYDISMIGGKAARVAAVSSAGTGKLKLRFDEAVTMLPGYAVRWRGPFQALSVYPIETVVDAWTCTIASDQVAVGNLVVVGEVARETRQVIVKSVQPGDDLQATLTLVDYAPAIYDSDHEPIPDYDPGISIPISGAPYPVRNVILSQNIYYAGRMPYAEIIVQWDPGIGPPPAGFNFWLYEDGDWTLMGFATGQPFRLRHDFNLANEGLSWENSFYPGPWVGRTVRIKVQPVGPNGERLPLEGHTEGQLVILPDVTPPPVVENFTSNVRRETLFLSWDMPEIPDCALYHIRWAPLEVDAAGNPLIPAWESMVVLADNITWSTVVLEVPGRSGIYAIKCADTTGNRSPEAAWTQVVYDWVPDFNVVDVINDAPTWGGLHAQTFKETVGVLRLASIQEIGVPLGLWQPAVQSDPRDVLTVDASFDAAKAPDDTFRIVNMVPSMGNAALEAGGDTWLKLSWGPYTRAMFGTANIRYIHAGVEQAILNRADGASSGNITPATFKNYMDAGEYGKFFWNGTALEFRAHQLARPAELPPLGDDPIQAGYEAAKFDPIRVLQDGYEQARSDELRFESGIEFYPKGIYQFANILDLGHRHSRVRFTAEIKGHGLEVLNTGYARASDLWNAWIEIRSAERIPVMKTWQALDDGTEHIPVDYEPDGTIDALMPAIWDPDALRWSPWQPLTIAELDGQVFSFRLILENRHPDFVVTPVIEWAVVTVDMQDRDEYGFDVVVPTIGANVIFGKAFARAPTMGIILEGSAPGDSYRLSSVTATGFHIELFNISGTAKGGQIDWQAQGYGRRST